MTTERQRFSNNLRSVINKRGLKQSDLADRCGVSTGTFSDWVNGRNYPRPDKLGKLTELLGVDLTADTSGDDGMIFVTPEDIKLAKEISKDNAAKELFIEISKLSDANKAVVRSMISALKASQNE